MDYLARRMYYFDMWLDRLRLKVLDSHRAVCAPDWTWDSQCNRWSGYHLWTIAEGRGTFRTPDGTFSLRPGDCFVLDMGQPHYGEGDPAHPLVVPAVHFEIATRSGARATIDRAELPLYRRVTSYPFLEQVLARCIEAHAQGDAVLAEFWLRGALAEIRRCDAVATPAAGDRTATLMADACATILADPGGRVRVPDLARGAHCTADHFIRLFRRHIGTTPVEYALRARTEAAKRLLRFSSHPVGRIADLLGYGDQYYFSRQFRKRTGLSPTEYRRG
jgi:AraC family transcriptional regulator of arabinose operon